MMDPALSYNLDLPREINAYPDKDFLVYGPVHGSMARMVTAPVKYSETVGVFVPCGTARISLSLRQWDVKGPCVIYVRKDEIMQIESVSDDLEAHFVMLSTRLMDQVYAILGDMQLTSALAVCPVGSVRQEDTAAFHALFQHLGRIAKDTGNPKMEAALVLTLCAFYWEMKHKVKPADTKIETTIANRTVEVFLRLVQQNFRQHRFLEFYADKMKITPKHLSRTVKQQTGQSATDWIERIVTLEAKVLLRSSTLNIKEITDYLNFPTQSFFSKYFKKVTGQSPTEFRGQ